ncbi:MAG: hypothetical protein GX754_03320, partial [Clostridiaceae bacterium]|nr:hypothetical protein [Clostridiaceae bacterium]
MSRKKETKKQARGVNITTGTSETEASSGGQSDSPFSKKLQLSWVVYNIKDMKPIQGTPGQKLIEERYNVELKIHDLNVHNEEEWTLFWASGNTADHIISNNMNRYIYKFADHDIIRPVSKEMLYSYAPDWMKAVTDLFGEDVVFPQITYKGEVWALPQATFANKISYIMAARKSWMDKVGISKAPETLEDLYTMIYKFAKEDPDRNGKDDTYGAHILENYTNFGYFWGTFGICPNSYYLEDGKVKYSSATEAFKEGTKVLAAWYKEGLIDPEFVTDNRNILKAKWADGIIGMVEDHPSW